MRMLPPLGALLFACLLFTPAHAQEPEAETAQTHTYPAELFVTAVGISAGQLVGAQVAWVPLKLVNHCLGRTLQGCQRVDYEMKYNEYYQQTKKAKDEKTRDIVSTVPTQPLVEMIINDSRYGASAWPILHEIAKLPAVVALLKSASRDMTYQQSLEPLQLRNAIKTTVYWGYGDDGENFRVLTIMP
ncbi:MAG: hypothetical protein EBV03_03145 [Proteobacteria bacterium]|nr:hypothetical protein [Pseudomonadota bacterium]